MITFDWPTWSQTAYRSGASDEQIDDPPRIEIEIRLRIQRLVAHPNAELVLAALPSQSPPIGIVRAARALRPDGRDALPRAARRPGVRDRGVVRGHVRADEEPLADGSILDDHFGAMGGWIASTLVRLGDLKLEYLPPDEEEVQR